MSISGSERTDSGTFRCAFTGLRIADRLAGTLTITRGTERICCVVFTGTVSSSTAPLPPIHEVPWIREQVRELQDRITGILQGGVLSVCREFRGAE